VKYPAGIAFVVLLLAGAMRLGAQEPAQVQAGIQTQLQAQETARQSGQPTLKPNQLEAMRNFEPAENEEYRLGKGDCPGRPEMQAKLTIGPDGRISLPLTGELTLAGLTRTEAANAIGSVLKNYYGNLAVFVSVTRYTSNRVLLLGAVDHPGMIVFDGPPTLLEAITRGGMLDGNNKVGQLPERCAIYRGRDQVLWVELKAMMESGNSMADLRLRRDDVVYIPDMSGQFVSVLGEVEHPGAIPLTHNSTLASVLAQAGGITDKAGRKPHIQIVDPASGTSRVFLFQDVLDPVKTLEITLRPGEIVYIPQTGFNRATYYLQRLSPLFTLATLAAYSGEL